MSTCQHRSMTCLLDGLSLPSHRSFDSNELSIQQLRCGAISSIVDASHKKTKKKTKTPVELEEKNKSCPNRLQGLTISFACPSTLPPLLQRGGPVVFEKNKKNKNTICTYIYSIYLRNSIKILVSVCEKASLAFSPFIYLSPSPIILFL